MIKKLHVGILPRINNILASKVFYFNDDFKIKITLTHFIKNDIEPVSFLFLKFIPPK